MLFKLCGFIPYNFRGVIMTSNIIEKISEFAPKFVDGANITVTYVSSLSRSIKVTETGQVKSYEISWNSAKLYAPSSPYLTIWCEPIMKMRFHDKSEMELETGRDDFQWPLDTIGSIWYFGGNVVQMWIKQSRDPRFCGPLHVKITR